MIAIEHCSKRYGTGTDSEVRALHDLSLRIAEREFIVVIGTNGSGKSTLLNALAGTVMPDAGRITIGSTDVTGTEAHQRAGLIGRVFQNPFSGTAPTMTVAENLRLASLRGLPKKLRRGLSREQRTLFRERLAELGMGLEERMETPVGLLSGGQRQALTLLMATLREPKILLLDEHTAALDPRSGAQVMELTSRIIERHNLTALMVTHDMTEASQFGTRLLMMHLGEIVLDISGTRKQEATPETLLAGFAALRSRL